MLVLIAAGLHVPDIPLRETACKDGAAAFWHIDGIEAKAGTVGAIMVTSRVAVVAHAPAAGVNV
jgi:hypothetical protein